MPLLCSLTVGLTVKVAHARPTAPTELCKATPDIPACLGTVPSCALCHDGTDPPRWNAFGEALKRERTPSVAFEADLPRVLEAVGDDDADGDGRSNRDELAGGRDPGRSELDDSRADERSGAANPQYRVGEYDPTFAFKRVAILYCARSPSYEELSEFRAGDPDDATLKRRLHEKLDQCLRSEYWQTEGLARLADKRIRPVRSFSYESEIQIGQYRIVIGDYRDDYSLWRHIMTEDRDFRELLTAQYHVRPDKDGKLQKVMGVIPKSDPEAIAGGQPIPPERRAGMLTTQWFLTFNTMFSALPRTTAAQAYRAYLGADISNGEGLRPVAGEPVDVDQKGVKEPRCANCHSTLDPLSYAFAEYEGIRMNIDLRFGDYIPERPRERMPLWNPSVQQSAILGTKVTSLVEWAKVAADSDEFKRAMTLMFFNHAVGRSPLPEEQTDLVALWRTLPEDGYSANRLLHRLIDTLAFGRP